MWLKNLTAAFLLVVLGGCTSTANDDDSSLADSSTPDSEVQVIDWTECGGLPGDHACDFTFKDQNDVDWSLYDHHGTVMVLDFSAVWCGWCKVAAAEVQALQDHFDPTGTEFLWVTILVDDSTGNPPTLEIVEEWASAYGITSSPVLQGDRSIIDATAENGYPVTSWPMFLIIDEDLIIENGLRGWSQELLFSMIADALAEE